MEYECATDSGCHWCSRSIQVRLIWTNEFDEEFPNEQTETDFFVAEIHEPGDCKRNSSNNNRRRVTPCQRNYHSKRRWRCLRWNRAKIRRQKINWKFRGLSETLTQCIKSCGSTQFMNIQDQLQETSSYFYKQIQFSIFVQLIREKYTFRSTLTTNRLKMTEMRKHWLRFLWNKFLFYEF